jgi:hypothetical protein
MKNTALLLILLASPAAAQAPAMAPTWIGLDNVQNVDTNAANLSGGQLLSSRLPAVHQRSMSPWLPKWATSQLNVLTGAGEATLLVISDSIGVGFEAQPGNANSTAYCWPVVMQAKLQALGYNASPQTRLGMQGWQTIGPARLPIADTRILSMGGYTGSFFSSLGGQMFAAGAAGSPLQFRPTVPVNYFRVYYATDPSFGTFKIDVNGGTPVTVNAAAAQSVAFADVKSETVATSTLNITPLSGHTEIIGFSGFNSDLGPFLTIWNGSFNGAKAGDFTSTTYPWSTLNMIGQIAPTLTIIDLTINDSGTAPATYAANLQTIITKAQLTGDVILVSGLPSDLGTVPLAAQQLVNNIAASVAAKNKVPFISSTDYFGSYLAMAAAGMESDTVHPNASGHAAFADMLAPFLR